jgi:hypothetical protein
MMVRIMVVCMMMVNQGDGRIARSLSNLWIGYLDKPKPNS